MRRCSFSSCFPPCCIRPLDLIEVPSGGLVIWGSLCVVGWLSAIVTFLRVGLGDTDAPLFRVLFSFIDHLGDGHPLRGLGLSEVVGLSVAFDITVLMLGGLVVTAVRIWSARSQQRTVLDLVAEAPDSLEGVCLLRHPYPMAYFVPGDGGRVVLSTGAVDVLSRSDSTPSSHTRLDTETDGTGPSSFRCKSCRHSFRSSRSRATRPRPCARTSRCWRTTFRDRGIVRGVRTALTKAALFQPPPVGALNAVDGVIDRRINRLSVDPVPARVALTLLGGVSGAAAFLCLLVVGH